MQEFHSNYKKGNKMKNNTTNKTNVLGLFK